MGPWSVMGEICQTLKFYPISQGSETRSKMLSATPPLLLLEHIEEDEVVLASMLHALRPGGGVAITVPQHPWLWSATDESACHVRRYQVGELREKVLRAGFTLVFETSFVSLLLPVMLASRLAMRRTRAETESMSELSLPLRLNRLFEMVMNAERYLIQRGFRFGWGGSRLLIAEKRATP